MKYAPAEQYIELLKAERDRLSAEVAELSKDPMRVYARKIEVLRDTADRYRAALQEIERADCPDSEWNELNQRVWKIADAALGSPDATSGTDENK